MDTQDTQPLPSQPTTQPVENPNIPNSPSKSKFFLIGGVILGVLFIALLSTFLLVNNNKPPVQNQPSVTQVVKQPLTLTIESPTDNTLVTDGIVTIIGTTLPNTTVTLYSESDENSVESNGTGAFEGTLKLTSGINTVNITAYGDDGEEKTQTLTIVFDETND